MKVGRLLKLANAIERKEIPNLGFHMGWYFSWYGDESEDGPRESGPSAGDSVPCGSSACIVGWTCLLLGVQGTKITPENAREILGLDEIQARQLFYNRQGYFSPEKYCGSITDFEAVAGIRKMAYQELRRRLEKTQARVAALENAILSLS
jgi:hypothetical protein